MFRKILHEETFREKPKTQHRSREDRLECIAVKEQTDRLTQNYCQTERRREDWKPAVECLVLPGDDAVLQELVGRSAG